MKNSPDKAIAIIPVTVVVLA